MTRCFFASDLHGHIDRYQKLFETILNDPPDALFLGGDLLPSRLAALTELEYKDKGFILGFLAAQFLGIQKILKDRYPEIFLILGNDDSRYEEDSIIVADDDGLWHYAHDQKYSLNHFDIYGYSFIPPSPFLLKDWERYDVSRYIDPGCISPEEGYRTTTITEHEEKYATIADDLNVLLEGQNLTNAIFLFHAPPHKTNLDHCANEGKIIDFIPLETHIGSIAIRRMIETVQPLVTLHGHVHESARITGAWRDCIGRTHCFSAAHDGPELSLIRFDLENLVQARRDLI
jgi:Icc-related predicted phosphoesterase